MADTVHNRFNFKQQTGLVQIGHHGFTGFKAIHSLIFAGIFVHRAIVIHSVNSFQIMTIAHLKVVRVMGRRDFNRPSSKLRINVSIFNDRNFAIGKWQNKFLAHHIFIPFIAWVNRHRSITHHGFRTRCCNFNVAATVCERIFYMVKSTFIVFMNDFNIR